MIWVEDLRSKRRFTINQTPSGCGAYGRVHPSRAGGKMNVVEPIAEYGDTHNHKYVEHLSTCMEWERCQLMNMTFEQCLSANLPKKRRRLPDAMSQSMREELEPERYKLNMSL